VPDGAVARGVPRPLPGNTAGIANWLDARDVDCRGDLTRKRSPAQGRRRRAISVPLTPVKTGVSRSLQDLPLLRDQPAGVLHLVAAVRDRGRRRAAGPVQAPGALPHETPSEVVAKIIYLRTTYHFGPAKIAMYLKRYHDIEISQSGVWRILQRVNLSWLPAYQRYQRTDRKWKRYEKPRPGHAVQVDVKFIAPLASSSKKKYYQFTRLMTAPGSGCCGSTTG